jgi:transcription antitermination factor NusB
MLTRNQEQEKIMQTIYSYLFYLKNGEQVDLKKLASGIFECEFDEIDIYCRDVIVKALININTIDEIIKGALNEKIKLERMNIVAHAILLMSYSEVKYVQEINKSMMINVSVNLAKKYLDDGEYKFINAVLDKIL